MRRASKGRMLPAGLLCELEGVSSLGTGESCCKTATGSSAAAGAGASAQNRTAAMAPVRREGERPVRSSAALRPRVSVQASSTTASQSDSMPAEVAARRGGSGGRPALAAQERKGRPGLGWLARSTTSGEEREARAVTGSGLRAQQGGASARRGGDKATDQQPPRARRPARVGRAQKG